MAIEDLTPEEQDIVVGCMKAAMKYIDDWEAPTRLGLEIDELRRIVAMWPNIDDRDESSVSFLAINNSLNEVCHGFEIPPDEWGNWFKVPWASVIETYRKWSALRGINRGIR